MLVSTQTGPETHSVAVDRQSGRCPGSTRCLELFADMEMPGRLEFIKRKNPGSSGHSGSSDSSRHLKQEGEKKEIVFV